MQEQLFKTHVEVIDGEEYLNITDLRPTLTDKGKHFEIKIPKGSEPLVFYTATTGMVEAIGNMIDDKSAQGYAFGDPKCVLPVRNPFHIKTKERVYITEHLRLDGKSEYLATKHRISKGQLNFVNVGHIKDGERVTRLIIDVITGEHKWLN